jgi:Flp pilus assembly protein TadD/transglutaminase-like putative cysteine protease
MDSVSVCLRLPALRIPEVLLLLALTAAAPFASSQTAKPADYSAESLVIESAETTYRYNEDGTGEKLSTLRIRLQSESGTRQFSVIAVPFASLTEKPSIGKVLARHADGSVTETPSSDAIEMPAPVSQQAPLYSDLKVLQIPVRGLRTGDTLEYSIRVKRENPEAPSQFWDQYHFTSNFVVLSETLTLDVPSSKYVQQWSRSVKPETTEKLGRKFLVWHASQLKPTRSGSKKGSDDADSKKPAAADVAWSTFHTWAEVGEWYRSLAAPRSIPNDAIRAQADEITRGARNPAEQLEALYAFVSSHIRYVGIDFGVGRYQPHSAAEVLATRYGDCKDKDTLFEALLRAKGFASNPALIGANVELVPELPSPGFFNHVITTINLPTGRMWADTTPGVAPFQMLLSPLRDKQALVIPQSGVPLLDRTPVNPPFPLKDEFDAEGTLSRDGEFTGKVSITFRSDNEILVRAIGLNLAPGQWDQGAQLIANSLGFSGTVSNSQFDHPEDVAQPMHVQYEYTKKPFGNWDNFQIIPMLPANPLPQAPESQPANEIDLGAPRTESAVSRIHLPDGFSADLPDAVHANSQFASVDETYRLENGEFIVQQDIVVAKSKVPVSSWEAYRKFAKDASLATVNWVQLTSKTTGQTGPHPPKPGENNPAAADLIAEAANLEQRLDWKTALEKLDGAKKLNPEQPFLWSNYGYLAMVQGRPDEATEDFQHELQHYPDETYVVTLFAGFLIRRSHTDEARSVLQTSFDRDASQPQVAAMLASLQANSDSDQAIATLHKALAAKPDQAQLMSQLVPLLVRKGNSAEARELTGKLLNLAGDDPNLLNNAAYVAAKGNPAWQPLQNRIAALEKSGVSSPPADSKELTLQDERTFKLSLSSTCRSYESATFRLELSSSGGPDILQVGGDTMPSGTAESLKNLKLPHLVPSSSKARILRDAVLSCSGHRSIAFVLFMPLGGINAEKAGQW